MKFKFDFLDIGTKIKIRRVDDKEEVLYSSQVLDILDQDTLEISGPLKKRSMVLIHNTDTIEIYCNVQDKGYHFFKNEILSMKYFPVYSLNLRRTSDIEKIQLRKHYRLSTTLNLDKEHYIFKDNERVWIKETCEIKDISGGGMLLYSNTEHKKGDIILCSMKIRRTTINFKATIVRVTEIDSFNYTHSLGISFIDMDDGVREQIIKYIFEQQRILRVKGLI